jgi:hypothetical protein
MGMGIGRVRVGRFFCVLLGEYMSVYRKERMHRNYRETAVG